LSSYLLCSSPFLRVLEAGDVVSEVVFEIANVSELQAFAGIVSVFVVSIPASVPAASVYNPEHPKSFSCPNNGYSANPSSSAEVANGESVDNSKCDRANYGSDSMFSNMGLRHNKNLEHCCNKPSHDHNTVSDTNGLPMDATRNHSRKTGLRLYQEQRKHHWYLVIRLHSAVLRM